MRLSDNSFIAVLVGSLGLLACAGASKSVAPPPGEEATPTPAALFSGAIEACTRGDANACQRLATRVLDGARPAEIRHYAEAFRAGCEEEIPDACAGLSMAEFARVVPEADADDARERLAEACDAGSSLACSVRIEDQIRHAEDSDEKRELIAEAGQKCDRLGGSVCFTVGSYYASGDGVTADEQVALRWLTRGCNTGSAYACYYLAMAREERGDAGAAADARPLYEKACAADVGPACLNLAYALFKAGGQGEHARAVGVRGCRLGDPKACDLLALSHDGANLEDPAKAYGSEAERLAAYRRYCAMGGAESCTEVAFAQGGPAEKSGQLERMEPVLALLQQGCSRGSMRGCNTLGHVVKDAIRACDAGDAAHCLVAGFAYTQGVAMPAMNGPTIKKDEAKAKAAFQKACDGGRQEGCRRPR